MNASKPTSGDNEEDVEEAVPESKFTIESGQTVLMFQDCYSFLLCNFQCSHKHRKRKNMQPNKIYNI